MNPISLITFLSVFYFAIGVDYHIDFQSFDAATISTFKLNGQTNLLNPNADQVLRITNNSLYVVGSGMLNDAITLDATSSFSTAFSFKMHSVGGIGDEDGIGADGLAFVINSVTNEVGYYGAGMGYVGLVNSVVIEFDTFNNPAYETEGNHIGINTNGNGVSIAKKVITQRLNDDNIKYCWVDFNGATQILEARYSNAPSRPLLPDLSVSLDVTAILGSNNVYIGFSAATGMGTEFHEIHAWEFFNTYNPIDVTTQAVEITSSQITSASLTTGVVGSCATWNWPGQAANDIGYFCADNGSSFWMCLTGVYASQSSKLPCASGTMCRCAEGVECSSAGSPCTF